MYSILPAEESPDDHGDGADTPRVLTIGYIDQMILISTRSKECGTVASKVPFTGTGQRWTMARSAVRVPARAAFRGIA
jgi:hypothetical protein